MARRIRLRVSGAGRLPRAVGAFVSNANQKQALDTSASTSLVAQGFHRIQTSGEIGRNQCGKRTDEKGADTNDRNVSRDDFRRYGRKLIDFARENLDVQRRCQPMAEFVPVTN